MEVLTKQQARRFLLLKQGLLGPYQLEGKEGVLSYIRQAGCIQFDPIDVCGRNAELTLQSRVKGFTKEMLRSLLYEERLLVDYPDKNLSILPVEDWPGFSRYREASVHCGMQFQEVLALQPQVKAYIREHGPVSAEDLPVSGKVPWHSAIHWSGNWHGMTNAARSVLEQLYAEGELVIHHKNGSRKFYDLAERHMDAAVLSAPDPYPDDWDHQKWRVLRRIGAVGLMWDRPSDAWLGIWNLRSEDRTAIFRSLQEDGKIQRLDVEGISVPLYCRTEDLSLLKKILDGETFAPRCEFLAPLDCMMWDRKLIRTLFGFDYSWEIYTPEAKRKFGYYVLPILFGDQFAGRIEAVVDQKTATLQVKHIWFEDGVRQTKKLTAEVNKAIKRFAKFHQCNTIEGLY